jgi:hypothetical protein
MTSFLDPSVQFGLQFGQNGDQTEVGRETTLEPKAKTPEPAPEKPLSDGDQTNDGGDNVVTLDQFRKD